MPDQFIEDLPDGGNLQPTDLLYFQRNIAGTWNDFNIRAGAVNGVNVLVHQAVYTEADIVGAQSIILFTVAAGKVAVFLPDAFVKYESPSPTGLASSIQIGSIEDELSTNWSDVNTVEYLSFAAQGSSCVAGQAGLEVSSNLAPGPFTVTVSVRYVLVSV
jgi:L-fucose isomerase-like protein